MRKILFVAVLFWAVTVALYGVEWAKDMQSAQAKALKEHKPLMVFIEADYCRWCKKMKYRTLGDDKIEQRLNKEAVAVKIDEDEVSKYRFLPPVEGIPTTFFFSPDGSLMQEIFGYVDTDVFNNYFDSVIKALKSAKKR